MTTRLTITPTTSGSPMGASVRQGSGISYRPTTHWHVVAAGDLRVKNPAKVRGWADVYPERVEIMLRSMNRCGQRALADQWMARFEGAFVQVPDSFTGVFRVMVLKDSTEDVKRDDFLLERTIEREELYLACLKAEVAEKQRTIRSLEARKAARA